MNQNDLAEAIQTRLIARLNTLQVGIGKLPIENPTMPYCILYPLGVPVTTGSYNDPDDTGLFEIQITCVGMDPKQVAWIQEFVRETIMERSGSGWSYSLAISGSEPESRDVSLGSITESDTELHQCDDIYTFRRSFV